MFFSFCFVRAEKDAKSQYCLTLKTNKKKRKFRKFATINGEQENSSSKQILRETSGVYNRNQNNPSFVMEYAVKGTMKFV